MFQSFDRVSEPDLVAPRVAAIRALMDARGLDALLVPRADEHQGEYVPPSAERLRWLTGFTGSAGLAIIARSSAALLVDGRYTVQARNEVDTGIFELPVIARGELVQWLAEKLPKGATVGFDPWLHAGAEVERLTKAAATHGLRIKALTANLVDRVWGSDRPAPPANPIEIHPMELAGQASVDKLAAVRSRLDQDGQDAVILTEPDSIAWLFNIRGSDVAHNPVVLAFAIVPAKGRAELFVAPEKLTAETRAHLKGLTKLVKPETLLGRIRELRASGKRVRIDPATAAYWFVRALGPKSVARGADPCLSLKARKNPVEVAGSRAAHVRDGAAVTKFLAWLDREAADGGIDEITAVRRLEDFRRETNQLREISFDTISGSGPNGAIVHYRVSEATNRSLKPGELFLIDSGAQYRDGTTDVTRTVAIGQPSDEMRLRFTLVLKGHIAIATARFPKGTRGIDLDPFARRALWDHGLDYSHGTGHGVGSFLSVHEGPQSISRAGMAVLEQGMLCSNEPGYYKDGAYGIRIENLVLVTAPEMIDGADRETMAFETVTLVPIDRRLVMKNQLSQAEADWLDVYHARVMRVVGPEVDAKTRAWLKAATAPL